MSASIESELREKLLLLASAEYAKAYKIRLGATQEDHKQYLTGMMDAASQIKQNIEKLLNEK